MLLLLSIASPLGSQQAPSSTRLTVEDAVRNIASAETRVSSAEAHISEVQTIPPYGTRRLTYDWGVLGGRLYKIEMVSARLRAVTIFDGVTERTAVTSIAPKIDGAYSQAEIRKKSFLLPDSNNPWMGALRLHNEPLASIISAGDFAFSVDTLSSATRRTIRLEGTTQRGERASFTFLTVPTWICTESKVELPGHYRIEYKLESTITREGILLPATNYFRYTSLVGGKELLFLDSQISAQYTAVNDASPKRFEMAPLPAGSTVVDDQTFESFRVSKEGVLLPIDNSADRAVMIRGWFFVIAIVLLLAKAAFTLVRRPTSGTSG